MDTVSPFLRKLLALTILACLVYAAWSLGVRPLSEAVADYEQDTERNAEFLGRYLGFAAARPDFDAELARLRKVESTQGGFLKADNPSLAAAALQDRLKRVITKSGGILKSVQVLAPETDGNTRKISVDVMITAEIAPLKDILYDLETGIPYLFVDEIDLRRTAARIFAAARGRGAADAAPVEDPLQVRFKVTGFMRGANP